MARNSHPFPEIALSGNVYLAPEVSKAPANGDLRLKPPGNPQYDIYNEIYYIKVEFLWEEYWHPLLSWQFSRDLQMYQSTWSDPLALIKIYQRLLKVLYPHLKIEHHPELGYDLNILGQSRKVANRYIMAAYDESRDLFGAHAPQP